MKLSKHTCTIASPHTAYETGRLIYANTLISEGLNYRPTQKKFIGVAHKQGFMLIHADYAGPICVATGEYADEPDGTSTIEVSTGIHKIFIRLWVIWAVIIGNLMIGIDVYRQQYTSIIKHIMFLLIAAALFRLALHAFYNVVRKHTIARLTNLVQNQAEPIAH